MKILCVLYVADRRRSCVTIHAMPCHPCQSPLPLESQGHSPGQWAPPGHCRLLLHSGQLINYQKILSPPSCTVFVCLKATYPLIAVFSRSVTKLVLAKTLCNHLQYPFFALRCPLRYMLVILVLFIALLGVF